jgi:hypothetical protein
MTPLLREKVTIDKAKRTDLQQGREGEGERERGRGRKGEGEGDGIKYLHRGRAQKALCKHAVHLHPP